ncbi:MAG: hypothetical protein AAF517_17880 [Planctomycetota bacterium]
MQKRSSFRTHARWITSVLVGISLYASGCAPRIPIEQLANRNEIEIVLDCNTRTVTPKRRIKFFVDVLNQSQATLSFKEIDVELLASPRHDPSAVNLRRSWTYRWARSRA